MATRSRSGSSDVVDGFDGGGPGGKAIVLDEDGRLALVTLAPEG